MIKTIIKIGLVALVAIIGFNYFFGTPEEKANSKKIVESVKDAGKSAVDVIKSEKEKFSEGKMDRVIEDLGNWIDKIRNKNSEGIIGIDEKASELEETLKKLGAEMRALKAEKGTESKERRALRKKMRQAESEIQKLAAEVGLSFDGDDK